VIDGLLPVTFLTGSMIGILFASIKYYKSRNQGYEPLLKNSHLPTANNYGSAIRPDSASDDTVTMDIPISSNRWSLFNLSRFLFSFIQFTLCLFAIQKIHQGKYKSGENEGSELQITVAYMAHAAFWVNTRNRYKEDGLVNKICMILDLWIYSFNRKYLSFCKLQSISKYYL
jgi:hypothetical protein